MSHAPSNDPLGAFVPGVELRREGAAGGPLEGLTFAAKDIFDVAGYVTGCGNPDWARTHGPAEQDAWAVERLLGAGATLVGKTITDELAYSLNGQNYHYGTPANANAPGRIPGGSSSGSAAAVAGGLVDTALGSDTGGSVRVPASYCGLYGLRPSHGRIPLQGVMPLAPSFDTVGWFARDPALLRRVGEVLLGEAAKDAAPPHGLLIAEDAFEHAQAAAAAQFAPLVEGLQARLGRGERVQVSEPEGFDEWMWHFRHIQAREIAGQHWAWIETTEPTFGPEIDERFSWALGVTDDQARAGAKARDAFTRRIVEMVSGGRVLCLPTAPAIAPRLEASAEELVDHRSRTLGLTAVAGLSGLPQITMPLAELEGCPLGLSLIGPPGGDMMLLAFAEAFAGNNSAP